ncbi:MAG: methyltransferase domain-containing protein [Firmicutes bacterium]|nr:methyltransferase domain-containing protein [Bacillota bacterium]
MVADIVSDFVKVKPQDAVLVLGCGSGSALSQLAKAYPQNRIVAVGFHRMVSQPNLEHRKTVFPVLPFPAETFPVVIGLEVLTCSPKGQQLINEVNRVLKPKGQALFVEFPTSKMRLLRKLFRTADRSFSNVEDLRSFLAGSFPTTAVVRTEDYLIGICHKQVSS